jgi:polyisoprenoid-binding protein YceI
LNVAITLHGVTHSYEVPARIESFQRGITIDGKMSLNQTDFGIAPLSVLGGALQVQDRVDLRFHILANGD